eukprot:6360546-Amphidinium_carterae.1
MAARHKSISYSQLRLSTRLIFGLLASLVAMFGVSFAAVELVKDTHVGDDKVVGTGEGEIALIGSKVVGTGEGEIALIGSADLMVVNSTLFDRKVVESCSGGLCPRAQGADLQDRGR